MIKIKPRSPSGYGDCLGVIKSGVFKNQAIILDPKYEWSLIRHSNFVFIVPNPLPNIIFMFEGVIGVKRFKYVLSLSMGFNRGEEFKNKEFFVHQIYTPIIFKYNNQTLLAFE